MKNNKLLLASLVGAMLTIVSCEKENLNAPVQEGPQSTNLKTIIVGGEPMYAGYGYDPVKDRAYRNAIDPWSTFESTDIKEALTVEVEAIETKSQLEKFVGRSFSIEANVTVAEIFEIGASIGRDIEEKITIDENHVTVIARIKSRSHKYICDNYPFLTDRAQQVIDRGNVKQFAGNFGLMYVNTRVVGGEVYYVYNYDYRQVTQWDKKTFKAKVTAGISGIFGVSVGGGISNEDKELISNAQKSASITSTIPGYAPSIITDMNQVNGQIAGIQGYLNNNPEKATTVEMVVKPYSSFIEWAELEEAFNDYIEENSK